MTTSTGPAWHTPGATLPALEEGAVHVWRLDLDTARADYEASRALLSADEQARADRYRFDGPRLTYVAGRAALRRTLARYLDVDPAELRFRYGEQGKPALDGHVLSFNLSHSDRWAVLAVAAKGQLGVDVERVRTLREMDDVARTVFSRAELASYASTPLEDRQGAFFNGWTRKEAFIKALGSGLALPLRSFTVSLDDPAMLVEAPGRLDPASWFIGSLSIAPEFAGALAIDHPGAQIYRFNFDT